MAKIFPSLKSASRLEESQSGNEEGDHAAETEARQTARVARGAYLEARLNGARINWHYWLAEVPRWSAAQAARLMRGLDPDVFADLTTRPTGGDLDRIAQVADKAMKVQRAAEAQGRLSDTPTGWLAWARGRGYVIHEPFSRNVEQRIGTGPEETPPRPASKHAKGRVAWRKVLSEQLGAIDAAHGRQAHVTEVIRWLKKHGAPQILGDGGPDELAWLDDLNSHHTVDKKTVSNAMSAVRRSARNPR
jgi:hypothetical protein